MKWARHIDPFLFVRQQFTTTSKNVKQSKIHWFSWVAIRRLVLRISWNIQTYSRHFYRCRRNRISCFPTIHTLQTQVTRQWIIDYHKLGFAWAKQWNQDKYHVLISKGMISFQKWHLIHWSYWLYCWCLPSSIFAEDPSQYCK